MAAAYQMESSWVSDFEPPFYFIAVTPACTVPLIHCPECGGDGSLGLPYPSVDSAGLDPEIRSMLEPPAERGHSLTLAEFDKLQQGLIGILGPNRPVVPLSGLGPYTGQALGRFPDFAMESLDFCVFARRSVYSLMIDQGFPLTGVPAQLTYRRERRDPLVHIEAPPAARFHPDRRPQPCATCHMVPYSHGDVILDAATFDDTIPIQRVYERANVIVVNEAFAEFVRGRDDPGVTLTPVELR